MVSRCKSPGKATIIDDTRGSEVRVEAAGASTGIVGEKKSVGVHRGGQRIRGLAYVHCSAVCDFRECEDGIWVRRAGGDNSVQSGDRIIGVNLPPLR
jgi:hypothetical protein